MRARAFQLVSAHGRQRRDEWASPCTGMDTPATQVSGGPGDDGAMMRELHRRTPGTPNLVGHPMMTIEKLRALAYELDGEALNHDHRHLCAQAYIRRLAAKALMKQADSIQREDAMFADPPVGSS